MQTVSMTAAAIALLLLMPYSLNWVQLHDNDLLLKELHSEVLLLAQEFEKTEELLKQVVEENTVLREENEQLKTRQMMGSVVYNGRRESNLVALTIDDGWDARWVEKTLDILGKENATATLFPVGSAVKEAPQLWRRAVEEGHELGNHTYSHRYLTALTGDQIYKELDSWQKAVDAALGYKYATRFFRPPGMAGFTGRAEQMSYYQSIMADKGMAVALWDVETFNALYSKGGPRLAGSNPNPKRVADYIVREATGGSIILLHFIPLDVEALPAMIRGLREKGLELVTLSEMFFSTDFSHQLRRH